MEVVVPVPVDSKVEEENGDGWATREGGGGDWEEGGRFASKEAEEEAVDVGDCRRRVVGMSNEVGGWGSSWYTVVVVVKDDTRIEPQRSYGAGKPVIRRGEETESSVLWFVHSILDAADPAIGACAMDDRVRSRALVVVVIVVVVVGAILLVVVFQQELGHVFPVTMIGTRCSSSILLCVLYNISRLENNKLVREGRDADPFWVVPVQTGEPQQKSTVLISWCESLSFQKKKEQEPPIGSRHSFTAATPNGDRSTYPQDVCVLRFSRCCFGNHSSSFLVSAVLGPI